MSAQINKPGSASYWIITNNGSYSDGVTGPAQVTTVGSGWSLFYIGNDYDEYVAKCNEVMITPRINSENEMVLPQPRISARQVRLWLMGRGVSLSSVEAAIDSIEDPILRDSTRVEWEYAPYIERNHPMLAPLASNLGLSEQNIDEAFVEAALL
jgi:hypothetical protein